MVLSACETGRGVILGEGVAGLGRALLKAGVPAAVLSLWPVRGDATSKLMQKFYKKLARGLPIAVAMQQAMKAMIAEKKLYGAWRVGQWAAFMPYGLATAPISEAEAEAEIRSAPAVAHGENPEEMVRIAQVLLDSNRRPAWLADLLSCKFWESDEVERWSHAVQRNVNVGGLECATEVLLSLCALFCRDIDLGYGDMSDLVWKPRLREEALGDREEVLGKRWNEIVAEAFFKALSSSRSPAVKLTLSNIFVTARAGAHLGQCLNTNSTLQELCVELQSGIREPRDDDEWDVRAEYQWWTALSNSLSANATLRMLQIEEPYRVIYVSRRYSLYQSEVPSAGLVRRPNSALGPIGAHPHLAAIRCAVINKLDALTDLSLSLMQESNEQGVRELLSPVLTNPASTVTSLKLAYHISDDEGNLQHPILVTAEALLRNTSTKLESLWIDALPHTTLLGGRT